MKTYLTVESLKNRVAKVYYELLKINDELESLESDDSNDSMDSNDFMDSHESTDSYESMDLPVMEGAQIIPFPGSERTKSNSCNTPFLAKPGMSLPPSIPDFRKFLQRDGLILLGWEKRNSSIGDRYTAYWVTSMGTARFYASGAYAEEDFHNAEPDHKSYAAEDGIEFYGQSPPEYMVHTAPELMMSNPKHGELRLPHILSLKKEGCNVDFKYKYLLTMEKSRRRAAKNSRKIMA